MTTPIEALAIVEDLIRRDPACFNLSDELQSVRAVLRSIAASLEGDAVERVARIIDPQAWRDRDYYDDYRRLPASEHPATKSSITKARALLATGLVADESATALTEAFAALTEARAEIEVLKIEKNEAFKIGHLLFDAKNSWEHRAIAAESELSTLRARVREVVGPFASRVPARSFRQPDGTMVARAGIQIEYFRAARQLMEDLK